MKNIAVVWLTLGLALSLSPAQDAATAGVITKVLALEHAWNQAEQRKDAKALGAMFDSDLIYVDYDGSLRSKAEFLAQVKSEASQPTQELTESMMARAYGATVVVTGVYMAKGTEKGKAYVRRGRFVDTWAMRNGSWLCISSQSTPILP
jgi:ketosteroid isomerase-like protein